RRRPVSRRGPADLPGDSRRVRGPHLRRGPRAAAVRRRGHRRRDATAADRRGSTDLNRRARGSVYSNALDTADPSPRRASMPSPAFVAGDFKVFDVSGFTPRMSEIRARVRPKLDAIGETLAP